MNALFCGQPQICIGFDFQSLYFKYNLKIEFLCTVNITFCNSLVFNTKISLFILFFT